MKLLIFCKICFFTLFAFCNLLAQSEFPLKPILNYSTGFTNSENKLLEIGISTKLNPDESINTNENYLKFGFRLPHDKEDKNLAKIDKSTSNVLGFLGLEYQFLNIPISKRNSTVLWNIEPTVEYGTKEYEYFPDSTEISKISEAKNNFAIELKSRLYFSKRKAGVWQTSVFGRLRYAKSNEEGKTLHIRQLNSLIVKDLVVDKPTTQLQVSPAFGFNTYPGTDLPFSFSGLVYYYWEKKPIDTVVFKQRIRTEQWLYFYPLDKENLGLRIGFGLFQENFTKNELESDENSIGALISIKMDSNILKSPF